MRSAALELFADGLDLRESLASRELESDFDLANRPAPNFVEDKEYQLY
jgi:hypothetical protein